MPKKKKFQIDVDDLRRLFGDDYLEKIKQIVASEAGSKGGKNWWGSLSDSEKAARIAKMKAARKQKAAQQY